MCLSGCSLFVVMRMLGTVAVAPASGSQNKLGTSGLVHWDSCLSFFADQSNQRKGNSEYTYESARPLS